jgi:hypothetical protein
MHPASRGITIRRLIYIQLGKGVCYPRGSTSLRRGPRGSHAAGVRILYTYRRTIRRCAEDRPRNRGRSTAQEADGGATPPRERPPLAGEPSTTESESKGHRDPHERNGASEMSGMLPPSRDGKRAYVFRVSAALRLGHSAAQWKARPGSRL